MRVSLPPPAPRSLLAGAPPQPPEPGAQSRPLPRPRRSSAPSPPDTGPQPPAGKAQPAAAEPQPQPDMNHHQQQQQHQKPGEQQLSEPEDMEMEGKAGQGPRPQLRREFPPLPRSRGSPTAASPRGSWAALRGKHALPGPLLLAPAAPGCGERCPAGLRGDAGESCGAGPGKAARGAPQEFAPREGEGAEEAPLQKEPRAPGPSEPPAGRGGEPGGARGSGQSSCRDSGAGFCLGRAKGTRLSRDCPAGRAGGCSPALPGRSLYAGSYAARHF